MQHCEDHSGQCVEMANMKQEISSIKNKIEKFQVWVIIAMGSLIYQIGTFLGSVFIKELLKK